MGAEDVTISELKAWEINKPLMNEAEWEKDSITIIDVCFFAYVAFDLGHFQAFVTKHHLTFSEM